MSVIHNLQDQAAAFRAAVVAAGPDAAVPTCPDWDVRKLVRHLARVYSSVQSSLSLEPTDPPPKPDRVPEDFDLALASLDANLAALIAPLSTLDPDRPVWAFFPGGTPKSWTRRMLHETAIHRMDAESAAGNTLIFDTELAADGIDEMLTLLLPASDWSTATGDGRVLYHAADAGRTWLVTLRPGAAPEVGAPSNPALDESEVDAVVAGTADTLYRRVWGRPSTAVITGDTELAKHPVGR